MKEVKEKRVAGPFDRVPYEGFYQISPLKLVPKQNNKLRLVYNLSWPKGKSVNDYVAQEYRSVVYPDFNDAVRMCMDEGKGAFMSQSDIQNAFRLAPVRVEDRPLQVMTANDPLDGVQKFFVDLNLPFGHAHSCKLFMRLSRAISHLVTFRTKRPNLMYLDDIFLANRNYQNGCDDLRCFLDICEQTGIPVSQEKTEWPAQIQTFLGLLINTILQIVCIPIEKRQRAIDMINFILNSKKVKVIQMQQITGLLNFLCKAIVPGRTFTRRLYAKYGAMPQYHHIRVDNEMRSDLMMWLQFLADEVNSMCRPFADFATVLTAEDLMWYSDSSFQAWGAYFRGRWAWGEWNEHVLDRIATSQISIQFLKLFAVVATVDMWGSHIENKRVTAYCDNQAVVHMVNNGVSSCRFCMILIRRLTLLTMKHNIKFGLRYIETKANNLADSLSRMDFARFWRFAPKSTNKKPDRPSVNLWPIPFDWWNPHSY